MLSVIIPTFNEKENIISTIHSILDTIPKTVPFEIIVIDDDSPDKTWDLVNKKFSKRKNIYAIRRINCTKGLSPSVIEGFSHAKGDYFLVMDADGQHDETRIPDMLKQIKSHDIVLGSRFIPGGSVKGWSKKRVFVSKVAALLAKPLLSTKINDPMSGFFIISKHVFLKVKNHINPQGYKIMLDILFAFPKASVVEVPYHFKTREFGSSKLGSRVIIDYLFMLCKQAIRKYRKFLKFCIVGISGVVINTGLLYFFTEMVGVWYVFSSIIAIESSIISNFFLNNFWTWKCKHRGLYKRLLQFNLVSGLALVVNLTSLFFFTEVLGVWYVFSNLLGIILATSINFILNDKWTFKK